MSSIMKSKHIIALLSALPLLGCGNAAENEPPPTQHETRSATQEAQAKMISFNGKVVRLEFEGGFWGIVTDDGQNLNPSNLPADFQHEGLRVRGKAQAREGVMGIQMWGTPVHIIALDKE